MQLKDVDLNLLVVFNELFKRRRVSAVGEVLGLSQPAVSNSLKRLRRLMGDELFIHTPRGMTLTPFAEQLAEPIAYALSALESTLSQTTKFDPITSTRRFTVSMTDIGEIYFVPDLMDALTKQAPGVAISTVRNTSVNLKDEMENGRVDLAIGLLPHLKANFFQRRLFRQRYVCVFRAGHPLGRAPLTLEQFSSAEHVVVVAAGTGHGKVDEILESQGISRNVRLSVPHFVGMGHILEKTDMIATLPERLAAKLLEPFGLRSVEHPASLPEIAINLLWHSKMHRDVGNQWLRSLIFKRFSDGSKDNAG